MLWQIITSISAALDAPRCWFYRGAFHFALTDEGDLTLAISCDSMHRIRLDTCVEGCIRATCWASFGDIDRAVGVALDALDEATAPAI